MTDRDLMQQALDALEEGLTMKEWRELVAALRERLAQPEQEPVPENFMDALKFDVAARDAREWDALYNTPPAAQRNKLALWMMARGYATGHGDSIEDLLQELEWQIAENWTRGMVNGVEAEREACAKVVLGIANDDAGNPYKQALRIGAEAIRART